MILPAIKSAILRLTGVEVQEVFASTDTIAVEMVDLVNEVAADIVDSHDWRALTKIATVTGGGEAHPLPSDYDRMLLTADVDDQATWLWGYEPFQTVNDWMRHKTGSIGTLTPGGWIVLGGELQFYPPPVGTAQYPYISNLWARSSTGDAKAAFTSDDDDFLLNDRLLTLGLIWRWLDQKDMAYAEAMQTYEIALARAQSRDKGARLLRTPRARPSGARAAYSGRPLG